MNNYYCVIFLCFCLFSCQETTKGQDSMKDKKEISKSKATQKQKTPSNDREKEELKGAVKLVISLDGTDSSIVVFDTLGRLIKEGAFYGSKGFSGMTYEFDSLGNPLKIYDIGRMYDSNDGFSTYFFNKLVNVYDSKGQHVFYRTVDTTLRDSYKCNLRYDDNGRLVEEKYREFGEEGWYRCIEYTYDKNGFLAKEKNRGIDGLKEMTLYENDQFGNVVKKKFYSPDRMLEIIEYTYDAAANEVLKTQINRELHYGEVEEIYHNRKVSKEDKKIDKELVESGGYPKPVVSKSIKTFDANNNCTSIIEQENGVLINQASYGYDEYNNRIKTIEKIPVDEEYSIEYEYDLKGNWLKRMQANKDSSLVIKEERIIVYYE